MENIRSAVCAVHVEVETREFWRHQRLWPNVAALMRNFGFTPLGRRPGEVQFDIVFVNDEWLERAPILVRWSVFKAWLRLRASRLLGRLRQLA
jgi:hypothetical protein